MDLNRENDSCENLTEEQQPEIIPGFSVPAAMP